MSFHALLRAAARWPLAFLCGIDSRKNRRDRVRKPRPVVDVAVPHDAHDWAQHTNKVIQEQRPSKGPPSGMKLAAVPRRTVPQRSIPRRPVGAPVKARRQTTKAVVAPLRRSRQVLEDHSPMEPQVVVEVVGTIARVFSHIPYAVVGLAAMVCHGLPGAKPSRIVLACPGHAKDVVRGWVIAQGLRSGHAPNLFSVMSSDGRMRVVEIGYIECGFEALAITHMGADQAKILSLATIANLIATAYVRELTIATINHHRQDTHADDLRWVLSAMIQRGERLSYPLVGSVMTLEFWVPFTTAYPDTVSLFADAGLAAEVDPEEGFAREEDFALDYNDSETSSRWSCEGTRGCY